MPFFRVVRCSDLLSPVEAILFEADCLPAVAEERAREEWEQAGRLVGIGVERYNQRDHEHDTTWSRYLYLTTTEQQQLIREQEIADRKEFCRRVAATVYLKKANLRKPKVVGNSRFKGDDLAK
jgi:hypothetical protein